MDVEQVEKSNKQALRKPSSELTLRLKSLGSIRRRLRDSTTTSRSTTGSEYALAQQVPQEHAISIGESQMQQSLAAMEVAQTPAKALSERQAREGSALEQPSSHNDLGRDQQTQTSPGPAGEDLGSAERIVEEPEKQSCNGTCRCGEEPKVRINIIIDPSSGEPVGSVTLLDNANRQDKVDGASTALQPRRVPTAQQAAATESTVPQNAGLSPAEERDITNHPTDNLLGEVDSTQNASRVQLEEMRNKKAQLTGAMTLDIPLEELYSGLSPAEAEKEILNLDKWIRWATGHGQDTGALTERQAMLKKKSSHRRVLKRRLEVLFRRLKNALLLREGLHSTHNSFELQKSNRPNLPVSLPAGA